MLSPIASFGVYWAEMLIAYIYFSGILPKRFSPGKCFWVGFGLFSVASLLNLLSGNHATLNLCVSVAVSVLFAVTCFRGRAVRNAFYGIILFVMNGALEIVTIALSSAVTGNAFLDYNSDWLLFLFEAISSKGLYFLAVLIAIRVLNPRGSGTRVPLNFMVYPVVSVFCLLAFWRICAQPWCPGEVKILMAAAGGCLFASSVFLFITYARHAEKEQEAMEVKSELTRLQTEQSYYQILEQQNQNLMLYAHDAKKHLAAIQALNDDPQIDSYVSQLSRQLQEYARYCHSGNKLLDVMIGKYLMDCEIRGIRFEYDVKVCNLSQMEDADLVAVLGNLMDNAIAAAEGSSAKLVSLNTVHRNFYSVIILSNSCDIPPKQLGNRLISTKSDAGIHGLGLKSVEKAIRKYQGDYEWEYAPENKLFTVTVMVAD